ATGSGSIAAGESATATGDDAVAAGTSATAEGQGSFAAGDQATATGANSSANGENATAVGQGSLANGATATAFGQASIANADQATAIGQGAVASQIGATAIGQGAVASGDPTFAGGLDAMALGNNSTALGANATAGVAPGTGDNTTAIGQGSSATGANSTALGQGADASLDNSVAIGQGATTSAASSIAGNAAQGIAYNAGAVTAGSGDVVSVGAVGAERQIQNVAAGAVSQTSTDAVNGSQLYAVQVNVDDLGTATAAAIGGGASYSPTAGLSGPSYTLNGSATTFTDVVSGEQALANGGAGPIQYSTPGTPSNSLNLYGVGGPVTLGNVAPGAVAPTSTQAINGSQLYASAASVAGAFGGGSTVAANGTVTAPSYDVNGKSYDNVGSAIAALSGYDQADLSELQNEINQNYQRANAGIASAFAASGLRYDDRPGKFSTAAAASEFNGEGAIAGGLGLTSDDGRWRLSAAFGISPTVDPPQVGAVGSVSYTWN
ncbi:MAG: YadA-like family protein, partial [Methylovirgula sp.]